LVAKLSENTASSAVKARLITSTTDRGWDIDLRQNKARMRLTDPNAHIVLPEVISKEPLAPAVRQGDDSWEDLVRWTHEAMVDAEELGVTQQNVDEMVKSNAPEVRRLLGA
jgi:ABC-type amino acid transport substrate-binding protein